MTLLRIREVAALLPVSESMIRTLISQHKLDAIRIGRIFFVRQEDVERLLREGTEPTAKIADTGEEEDVVRLAS